MGVIKEFFKIIFFMMLLSFALGAYIGGSFVNMANYNNIRDKNPELANIYFKDIDNNIFVKIIK